MKQRRSIKRILLLLALLSATAFARAQASFDSEGGCLNVVDFSHGQKLGEYGDKCISASYLHEVFINERFAIGGGIGYSHHKKYRFSAIPVFLSTHYFFLDKRFSPFVNLRFGGFGLFGENNVDTKEKYSLSSKKPDFNLFVSPAIGVKMHITPSIGILVSINDDAYLVNAFDTNKNDYKNNTTVPLKWTNRSLKSLKYSLLGAVLSARRFDFVILQPFNRITDEQKQICIRTTNRVSEQRQVPSPC